MSPQLSNFLQYLIKPPHLLICACYVMYCAVLVCLEEEGEGWVALFIFIIPLKVIVCNDNDDFVSQLRGLSVNSSGWS
jgi:hypothetical protein